MNKNYIFGFVLQVILTAGAIVLFWSPVLQSQEVGPSKPPEKTETANKAADFPEPPPGAIVFDMKYRGLSGRKNDLRPRGSWAFQASKNDPSYLAFLEILRKRNIAGLHPVFNPDFCEARQWSAVEVKNGEVVAFHFDLNADGRVSDSEKIPPTSTEKTENMKCWEFVTPDFLVNTAEGKQVPFRTLLRVQIFGSTNLNSMWSPSCVLEGTASFNGKPTKLILYSNGFDGSFQQFGRSSYSLGPVEKQTGQDVSRSALSSLVKYNGQYYRMKLQGDHRKDSTFRAVLEKFTGDTGEIGVELTGNSELKAKLSSAKLTGSKDDTIRLNISDGQSELPAESYKLISGNINYGKETPDLWLVGISEGPEFEITAEKTCNVELGKPVLKVRAIYDSQRYHLNAEEKSVFSDETDIRFSAKIIGKAGERYDRFYQKPDKSLKYQPVEPTIRVVDSKGKEVASATMDYG